MLELCYVWVRPRQQVVFGEVNSAALCDSESSFCFARLSNLGFVFHVLLGAPSVVVSQNQDRLARPH